MTLEQFAAFVQQQQPATVPWTPVTDYSFEARKTIEGQHPRLIKDVFRPRLVLDVGCGPEAVLVRRLLETGVCAAGFDKAHPDPLFRQDVTDPALPVAYWMADLVICREVLEHLTVTQIRRAVQNLVRLSSHYVYVTTRFHPDPHSLLDVQDHDDLDPTHITLLNKDFLRLLFLLEGCTARPDLETQMDWQGKGRCLVYEVA